MLFLKPKRFEAKFVITEYRLIFIVVRGLNAYN